MLADLQTADAMHSACYGAALGSVVVSITRLAPRIATKGLVRGVLWSFAIASTASLLSVFIAFSAYLFGSGLVYFIGREQYLFSTVGEVNPIFLGGTALVGCVVASWAMFSLMPGLMDSYTSPSASSASYDEIGKWNIREAR